MNPIIEAVKNNLDLSRNIPLKIAFYNGSKENDYFKTNSCWQSYQRKRIFHCPKY